MTSFWLNSSKDWRQPNNNFHQTIGNAKDYKFAKIVVGADVFWTDHVFLKAVARALERLGNWFYRLNNSNIEIVSEEYAYNPRQEAAIKLFYNETVCGEDIIRISPGNMLSIYLKSDSYALYTAGRALLYCNDLLGKKPCQARATVTGVLKGSLRIRRYAKFLPERKESPTLHFPEENDILPNISDAGFFLFEILQDGSEMLRPKCCRHSRKQWKKAIVPTWLHAWHGIAIAIH